MRFLALAALIALGCSSSGTDAPKGKAGPTPKVDAAKPKPPPVPTTADVEKLLPATAGMPVAAAKLAFSMTRAEAKAAIPDLGDDGSVPVHPSDQLELELRFHSKFDGLRYVVLSMPASTAGAVAKRWGPGREARLGRRGVGTFWHGGGIQAVLDATEDRASLTLWPYTPWKTLLGDAKTHFGFESTPLIGLERGAALAAVAAYNPKFRGKTGIRLRLPRHEVQEDRTWAHLDVEEGKVVAVAMRLDYRPDPKLKAEYEAAFEAKWGAPTKTEGHVRWFGDRVWVEDKPHAHHFELRMAATPPLPTPARTPAKP